MKRFVIMVAGVTAAGLLMVYSEVEAVRIGYTIRRQEEVKVQFLDRARALKYNIARLKAPHVLEKKLLAKRIELESPKVWQTLVISDSAGAKKAAARSFGPPVFTRFFMGTAQAEAKEPQSR